jgi:Fe-S-cluster containining protein
MSDRRHRMPRRKLGPEGPPPTVADARAALDELYAELPPLLCKGLCADSCTTVDASQLERDRIEETHGVVLPEVLGYPEMRRRAAAGEALPRCPALSSFGTCTVYDVRPFTCRAFGMVVTNPVTPHRGPLMCDHGCIPDGVMTLGDYLRALVQIEQLSRRVTGVKRTPGAPLRKDPQ